MFWMNSVVVDDIIEMFNEDNFRVRYWFCKCGMICGLIIVLVVFLVIGIIVGVIIFWFMLKGIKKVLFENLFVGLCKSYVC